MIYNESSVESGEGKLLVMEESAFFVFMTKKKG